MSDLYNLDPLSPAQQRLLVDAAFGPLNYPDDLARRDQYFREGLALVRTILSQTEKVRTVVAGYSHYATDPALKAELETFLQSLPKSAGSANLARAYGSS